MNKAISPGSEFTEVGSELPVELQYFGEKAAGSEPASPPEPVSPAPTTQIPPAPATASAEAKPKPAYPAPAALPTQQGPKGLRFDFNDGARVFCPDGEQHPWRIRLRDLDTGNILFETEFASGRINSSKRYYVRFGIEVTQQGETVLSHEYSARDRDILIQFPVGTLGDPLGWFPYAIKFKELHGCRLTCAMGEKLIALFRDAYPDINFLTHEEIKTEDFYATYSIGLFFDDKDFVFQPCDF